MPFVKENPFVRIILPFILGIILQFKFELEFPWLMIIIISAPVIITIQFLKLSFQNYHLKGITITLLLFLAGAYITQQNQNDIIDFANNKFFVSGIIEDVPELKNKNFKTYIAIDAIKQDAKWGKAHGLIVAYIEPQSDTSTFKAGQRIFFNTTFQKIKKQPNPFGFDYANYLLLKLISQSVYLKPTEYEITEIKHLKIKHHALNLRTKIISIYKNNGITGDNLAVLSALTLGYKYMLAEEVKDAFKGSGSMHVLAVSGLHIGIIYLIFEFLLIWLNILPELKRARFVIIIVILWGYTFITGLTPSVLRACIMFSFLLVGKLFNHRISIYNSLAASAFFILLFKPLLLFDIGFQLSYCAVLGIVFFHPYLSNWFYIKNKLLNGLWSLTAVSLAAQLATFPITIYYFNQFPTYFWLSNTIVTYVAFAILLLAVLLVAFSWFGIIATLISFLINLILTANLICLKKIIALPYAIIDELSLQPLQIFILYGLITTFTFWILTKNYKLLIGALSLLLMAGIFRMYTYSKVKNLETFCVYQIKNETGMQWISGNRSIWLSTQSPINSRIESLIYQGNMYWHCKNVKQYDLSQIVDTTTQTDYWYFNHCYWHTANSCGLILHSKSEIPQIPTDTLNLNYLIITGNPPFSIQEIPKNITYNQIIIDGSVPTWRAKRIINEVSAEKLYVTMNQGAYLMHKHSVKDLVFQ